MIGTPIIVADPQRMIRAGARAVDGRVKENGFTVLLCSAGGQRVRESHSAFRLCFCANVSSPAGRCITAVRHAPGLNTIAHLVSPERKNLWWLAALSGPNS